MTLVPALLIVTAIGVASAIPFEVVWEWVCDKVQDINEKLEKPERRLYLSVDPFLYALIQVSNFAKGFVPLWALQRYVDHDGLVMISVPLILIAHNWPFFYKFKNRRHFAVVLWGIYTFLWTPMIWVFPLILVGAVLVTNTLAVGVLASVVAMFFALWIAELPLLALTLNFLIFLVVFYGLKTPIFAHFEKEKRSLLQSFNAR